MSTDRKTRASQQNGARSHGPVTPEGRLKSSANSARHHLLSKTILLENERPDAFADLFAGLTREFNPQTETQRALVETMAVSRWRQMRIWAVERATLQSAIDALDGDDTPSATSAALAFRNLADDSRVLDILNRYETRFDRQFARALNLLIKLADPDCPVSRTAIPASPNPESEASEGAPSPCGVTAPAPENDFCQTNLIPFPDSGAGVHVDAGQLPTRPVAETNSPVTDLENEPGQTQDSEPAPQEQFHQSGVAAAPEIAGQPAASPCLPDPNTGHSSGVIRYPKLLSLSYIAIGPANAR